MPYKSKAQQRKFHAMAARGEISKAKVAEYDKATDFKHLPERVKKKVGDKPGNTEYPVKRTKQESSQGALDPLKDTLEGLNPSFLGSDKSMGTSENPTPSTELGPAVPGSKVGQVEYTVMKTYKGKAPF